MVAPHDCTDCGASIETCDAMLAADRRVCCGACRINNTHGDDVGGFARRQTAQHTAVQDVVGSPARCWCGEPHDHGMTPALPAELTGATWANVAAAWPNPPTAAPAPATIPPADEFANMCQMARLVSMSELAPKHLRGKPTDTLLIFLTARDLGIPMTSALRKVSVIEGQPSIDGELQLALVRQSGAGSIVPVADNYTQDPVRSAGAVALGPDRQPLGPVVTFSWTDAQAAEYADPTCLPEAHNVRTISRTYRDGGKKSWQGCECKDNWRKSPRDMLWWRAATRARRIYFPEATTGMYDADELGGVIDVEGRLVTPSDAPLPDGFTDPAEEQRQQQAAADAPCTEDELWALQERIRALPGTVRRKMKEAWMENERLRPFAPTSHAPTLRPLPKRLHTLAKNMLNGWDSAARKEDKSWDRDTARENVRAELGYHLLVETMALYPLYCPPRPEYPEATEMSPADPTRPISVQERAERGDPDAVARMAVLAELEQAEPDILDDAVDQVAAQRAATASEAEPAPDTAPEGTEAATDAPGDQSDDRDWRPDLREAAETIRRLEAVLDDKLLIGVVANEVKAMSWQAVDKALAADGVSTEGPIDLRRMRLSIQKLKTHEEPF
jgi:hypothetical protein